MRPQLLNELVSAAQDVVNNEELGHFSAGADIAAVGREDLDRLRKVVQEISDDACCSACEPWWTPRCTSPWRGGDMMSFLDHQWDECVRIYRLPEGK